MPSPSELARQEDWADVCERCGELPWEDEVETDKGIEKLCHLCKEVYECGS